MSPSLRRRDPEQLSPRSHPSRCRSARPAPPTRARRARAGTTPRSPKLARTRMVPESAEPYATALHALSPDERGRHLGTEATDQHRLRAAAAQAGDDPAHYGAQPVLLRGARPGCPADRALGNRLPPAQDELGVSGASRQLDFGSCIGSRAMGAFDRKILEAGRRAAVKYEQLAPDETPLLLEYAQVTELRDNDGRRWSGLPVKVLFGAVADRMFFCDEAGTVRLGTHLAMLTQAKLSFSDIQFQWLEREDVGVGATLGFPIKTHDAERVFNQLKALRDEVWRGIPRSIQVDLINRVGDMGLYFQSDPGRAAAAARRTERAFILGEVDAGDDPRRMDLVTTDLLFHPGFDPLADEPIHASVSTEVSTATAADPRRRRPAPKRR